MSSHEPTRREVDFDQLTLIGKAVYVSGQVARAAETVIDAVVDQAATLITEAEQAFREGLRPEIEDAKILEEFDEKRTRRRAQ